MIVANRPITLTGGHCWFMGGECDDVDSVRKMVRLHHKMGADCIKVMSTGGFMTAGSAPWFAQFTVEELTTIVGEAHRLGKRVSAHGHGSEGIARAVAAGVDTIEHCSFAREGGETAFEPELADAIAAKGIAVCPTVNINATKRGEAVVARLRQRLSGLADRGVRIIGGADAGINNAPHKDYVGALESMVALGLSDRYVLEAATIHAANALGVAALTGSLAPGKDADLIAVKGDPLSSIAALHDLELVMSRGVPYTPEYVGTRLADR